jgi:ketosteroid isomerase-like protein
MLSIWVFADDGLFEHLELFDKDDEAAALVRFDELVGADDAGAARQPFANAATLLNERLVSAWMARDWDSIEALHLPTVEIDDHRPVVGMESVAGTYMPNMRFLFDVPNSVMTITPIATRGERLALSRGVFAGDADVGGGPLAIDYLTLDEVDADGLSMSVVLFDSEDLDAAYAELDARYAAGEGAVLESESMAFLKVITAFNDRDWDTVIALTSTTGSGPTDHRLLGWGTTLKEEGAWLRAQQALLELSPDARYRIDHIRISGHTLLVHMTQHGAHEGGAFETPLVGIFQGGATNALSDVYAPEQIDEAFARFEELSASSVNDSPEIQVAKSTATIETIAKPSAATAAMDLWRAGFEAGRNSGDWARMRDACSPTMVFEDRQRHALVSGDREMMIASARERAAAGANTQMQLIGTAGDRLGIWRNLWSGGPADGRFELEYVAMVGVDESGLIDAIVLFDLDDVHVSQREMWARWVSIEPAMRQMVDVASRFNNAFNDTDRSALGGLITEDFVGHDHRWTGFGRVVGRAAYVDAVAVLWDLADDNRMEVGTHWLAYDAQAGLTTVRRTGKIVDGGDYESLFLAVFALADGRLSNIELFEVDALDAAFSRFEELQFDPLRIPPNAATRVCDRSSAAVRIGDWAAVAAQVSDDFVYEDRGKRALVSGDVETWISSMQFVATQPGIRMHNEFIATMGDRIALEHMSWSSRGDHTGDADFDLDKIRLFEIDADGRIRASLLFDEDDRADAFEEASLRFAAGEAAAFGGHAELLAFIEAFRRREWSEARALFADDFVLVDHRILGLGTLTGDAWIESLQALTELAPDVTPESFRDLVYDRNGRVWFLRTTGTVPDGGPFENVMVALAFIVNGRLRRWEIFDIEDADRAVARFRELSAEADNSRSPTDRRPNT